MARLTLEGYEAASAQTSLAPVLRSLRSFSPDAVLLETTQECRCHDIFAIVEASASAPIIVTGQASEQEQVWYLEHGAAEYLVSPVSFPLLRAYLRAVLRSSNRAPVIGVICVGTLEVDLVLRRVRHRGRTLTLTPTEFRLLQAMAENRGRPCSHNMLLERAWGRQFTSCTNYLRLYISYLRQKLEDDPANPAIIITDRGIGYRLGEPAAYPPSAPQPVMTPAG